MANQGNEAFTVSQTLANMRENGVDEKEIAELEERFRAAKISPVDIIDYISAQNQYQLSLIEALQGWNPDTGLNLTRAIADLREAILAGHSIISGVTQHALGLQDDA